MWRHWLQHVYPRLCHPFLRKFYIPNMVLWSLKLCNEKYPRKSRKQKIRRWAVRSHYPLLFHFSVIQIQVPSSTRHMGHSTDSCVEPEVSRIGQIQAGSRCESDNKGIRKGRKRTHWKQGSNGIGVGTPLNERNRVWSGQSITYYSPKLPRTIAANRRRAHEDPHQVSTRLIIYEYWDHWVRWGRRFGQNR